MRVGEQPFVVVMASEIGRLEVCVWTDAVEKARLCARIHGTMLVQAVTGR